MAKKPAGADPAKKIRQQIRRARKKAERKGMRFTALDNDEVRRKLKRANSPMIVFRNLDPEQIRAAHALADDQ